MKMTKTKTQGDIEFHTLKYRDVKPTKSFEQVPNGNGRIYVITGNKTDHRKP